MNLRKRNVLAPENVSNSNTKSKTCELDQKAQDNSYILFRDALKLSRSEKLSILGGKYSNESFERIFNKKGNNDNRRSQLYISTENTIIEKIRNFLSDKGIMEGRYIDNLCIVRSEKGCAEQRFHWDYDPDQVKDLSVKPGSIIVGIENGSRIRLIGRKDMKIDEGDILFFEGDCIHAGASYEEPNRRLHAYIDVPELKRLDNYTYYYNEES